MKALKENMRLYAVTDRSWLGGESLASQVERALRGGVTCVQLREKELCEQDFLNEAYEIGALCRQYGVPFIINDNVELALKCGADGVHVGQSDLSASQVRELAGDRLMIGVSAKTVEQALAAERSGAAYLGVGAVFGSTTKTDARKVSIDAFRDICAAVSIPVVAIGGINKTNMLALAGSGVDGVALVSAIFASEDIQKECKELRALSEKLVKM